MTDPSASTIADSTRVIDGSTRGPHRTDDLPAPQPGRFRPLRLGLVDMFLYDAQEFRFRDGRLLLRGDNGSGKSKVLALTLPLLLDANLHPSRMEPDGDPNKKMAWNLLLGDEHEERTGYTWVEFGRIDPDSGRAEFVTLGLGLKAVRLRGIVKQWWFVTDRRIGVDLHLADRTRTVRTRERLVEALGERGDIFDTNGRYRRAVDERLFGLHERYGALIDLLVSLRQPQLSKRPDAVLMDRALSDALPPLDPSLVDNVAQSFQSLEDEAAEVRRLSAEAAAVRRFTEAHRAYARVATARAADSPRATNARYEDRTRALRAAEEARTRAEADVARAEGELNAGTTRVAQLGAELEALRLRSVSPEFQEFAASGEAVRAAQRHASSADGASARADAVAGAQRRRVEENGEALAERERDVERVSRDLTASAKRAQILLSAPFESAGGDTLLREVRAEAERRGREVRLVTGLDDQVRIAQDAAADAQKRAEDAASELALREGAAGAARGAAEAAGEAWLLALDAFLADRVELRDDAARLSVADADGRTTDGPSAGEQALAASAPPVEAAAEWVLDPAGENPMGRWARAVRDALVPGFDAAVARTIADHRVVKSRILDLRNERDRLESIGADRPPVPLTRSADRGESVGAAFWELVDVADGLDPEAAAGLEAALTASGILDAWVTSGGEVVAGDTVLVPRPRTGRTLASLLTPVETATPVGRPVIEAVLASIAVVDHEEPRTEPDGVGWEGATVSLDGWFKVGPLVGSATATRAVYLGQTAREAERERRLREIADDLVQLDAEVRDLMADEEAVRARRDVLEREALSVPSDRPLRDAITRGEEAARHRSDAAQSLRDRQAAVEEARWRREAAVTALAEAVELYEMAVEQIPEVHDSIRELPRLAETVVRSVRMRESERRRAHQDLEALVDADRDQVRAAAAAEEASLELVTARSRFELLCTTVGADMADVERRLGETRTALADEEGRQHGRLEAKMAAATALGDRVARVEAAASERNEAAAVRAEAVRSFQRFARTGLIQLAVEHPDLPDLDMPWSPDPVTRLARRLLAEIGDDARNADWDAATNSLRRAYESLQGELSVHGRQASWEQQDTVAIVRVQLGNDRVAPSHLESLLTEDLQHREQLLSANERTILETHLIDEVGAQLHDRVVAAQQQVARMNDELEKRPTRSGLRLRIRWRPSDDELTGAGRALLQSDAAGWSLEERESIGEFLRTRLAGVREENPDGSWFDSLSAAFDYRTWNRFDAQINQGSGWRPASGPASGGEKVLAASVPLFAAASSYYSSAGVAHAPRLVLLDEAFAGVDDRSRASYLGLLAEFDLDVVMTSEREWATYPEVPGIGIANLFRLPGIDTVHVEHWEWDGATPRRLESGAWERSAIEIAPPVHSDDGDAGLFDFDGIG